MDVSVVGLGKLGFPLAVLLASKGHRVHGIDLNCKTVDSILQGQSPVFEPGVSELFARLPKDGLTASTSFASVLETDVTLIIVPTPSEGTGRFSSRYVIESATAMGLFLRKKNSRHVVVVCSTVMPGEMESVIRAALESSSGKECGGDELGLVYSPWFIALGTVLFNMQNPDMILIGESDSLSGDVVENLMLSVAASVPSVCRMSLVNAEVAKISVNAFVTMKISFANCLAELCERLDGADAITVTKAIGEDRRIGPKYLSPGMAAGGTCFPRDNRAVCRLGDEVGVSMDLAKATNQINLRQTERVLDKVEDAGRDEILVLGLSYKPGTNVTEESPGVDLVRQLDADGYQVSVHDPLVRSNGLFSSDVQWVSFPMVIPNDGTTIIALPDKLYVDMFPDAFLDSPHAAVIDCWGVIESGPWDDTNVYRVGRR